MRLKCESCGINFFELGQVKPVHDIFVFFDCSLNEHYLCKNCMAYAKGLYTDLYEEYK